MKRASRGKTAARPTPELPSEEYLETERRLNIIILIVLVIMLLAVIVIPGSWFNAASMWCRDHIPGF